MSDAENIDELYLLRSESTLRTWKENPSAGAERPPKFHPTKLALTTGDYVGTEIVEDICQLAGNDPFADIANPKSFHFSFLSISQPLYDSLEQIVDLDELRACFTSCCAGHLFTVRNLRLVALPDSLLLAGIPDENSVRRRSLFAQQLLQTPWRGRLESRYHGGSIPPAYWHSTLIRYNAERLPKRFREFFKANHTRRFGEITLPIRLLAANYSWESSSVLL